MASDCFSDQLDPRVPVGLWHSAFGMLGTVFDDAAFTPVLLVCSLL